MRRPYSAASYVHAAGALGGGLPQPPRQLRVAEDADDRVGDPLHVVGLDEIPLDVVADEVRHPAAATRDHGAAARERLDDHARRPLRARGEQQQRRLVQRVHDLGCGQRGRPARLPGQVGDERLDERRVETAADEPKLRVRQPRRREPPGGGDPVDVLVALEHADEERRRPLGQRRRRRRGEGGEVRVRGEDGGGLAPRARARGGR